MNRFKQIFGKFLLIGLLTLTLSCGSSSGGSGGSSSLTSEQAVWTGNILFLLNGIVEVVVLSQTNQLGDRCTGGGSLTQTQSGTVSTYTSENCSDTGDKDGDGTDETVDVVNGTMTFDSSTGVFTPQNLTVASTDTTTNDTITYIFGPQAIINVSTGEIDYDLSGTVDGTSFTVSGTPTQNFDVDVLNGRIDVNLGGVNIECNYTSFSGNDATPVDFANQCVVN